MKSALHMLRHTCFILALPTGSREKAVPCYPPPRLLLVTEDPHIPSTLFLSPVGSPARTTGSVCCFWCSAGRWYSSASRSCQSLACHTTSAGEGEAPPGSPEGPSQLGGGKHAPLQDKKGTLHLRSLASNGRTSIHALSNAWKPDWDSLSKGQGMGGALCPPPPHL